MISNLFSKRRERFSRILTSLKPETSSGSATCSEATIIDEDLSFYHAQGPDIGMPRSRRGRRAGPADVSAVTYHTRYEMERFWPDEALTSEVIDQVAEKSPRSICIVSLPPGGLAQTRYLCKRLRARFPDTKNYRRPVGELKATILARCTARCRR